MIMPGVLQPRPTHLTDHAFKLLAVMKSFGNGVWVTRSTIAVTIGKKKLNPYDVAMLDLLVEQGYCVVEKHPSPKLNIVYEYRYQATGKEG